MDLRNAVRRLSARSEGAFDGNSRATIIVGGALLMLAGFTIVKFLLNFDQLQGVAEEYSTRAFESGSSGVSGKGGVVSPGSAAASLAKGPAEVAGWLAPLNRYRAMVRLAPVTTDAQLSRGDLLHSHYLALNYAPNMPNLRLGADAHTEDSSKPGSTVEGAAAARASDVDWEWNPYSRPPPSWAIDSWIQVPFHRMQILDPYLRRVGYGSDCEGSVCFAALNTGVGVDPRPKTSSPWSAPLFFPPDGSVMDSGSFSGEWPDPLAGCPGYTPPSGLPITLELGHLIEPALSDYSLTRVDNRNSSIEACAFDAGTYVSSDAAAQNNARAILRDYGAIVVVPRRPLPTGRYSVAITAGQRYAWSFSIATQNRE
jgi:hypothetical protein